MYLHIFTKVTLIDSVFYMWFYRALKLTGPFVVMIYKMISGDMFTFSIIYGIMLLGFTQAFYFLYKRSLIPDKDSKFVTYGTTWMALFHMTLGDYDVSTIYFSIKSTYFILVQISVATFLRYSNVSQNYDTHLTFQL